MKVHCWIWTNITMHKNDRCHMIWHLDWTGILALIRAHTTWIHFLYHSHLPVLEILINMTDGIVHYLYEMISPVNIHFWLSHNVVLNIHTINNTHLQVITLLSGKYNTADGGTCSTLGNGMSIFFTNRQCFMWGVREGQCSINSCYSIVNH